MTLAAPDLNDILLGLYGELSEVVYGVATNGGATTLLDSGLGGADDDWKGGTVFVVAAGAAAPEGEFAEVTGYTAVSGTLTFASSGINGIGTAPAAGDEYALADKAYPVDWMRGAVNRSLVRMGNIPSTDETLTTAASTTEYTIPGKANVGLRRVYVAQSSTASNERWVEQTAWRQELNILIFRRQPAVGKTIKLVYVGPHARLIDHDDALSTYVHINRIVAETYYLVLKQHMLRKEGGDALLVQSVNNAFEELQTARKMYPIFDPGTPFKPILSGRKGKKQRRRNTQ